MKLQFYFQSHPFLFFNLLLSYSGLMIKVKQVNRLTQVDLNLFLIDLFFNFILKY
jgi:hypothetical protein